jgi:hypothetical protein
MRRFKSTLLMSLIAVAAATSGVKADTVHKRFFAGDSCYARTYEAAHMRKKPQQTVRHFYVTAEPIDPFRQERPGTFEVKFGFEVKGRKGNYQGMAECREAGATVLCLVEGDGGSFSMAANEYRLKVVLGGRLEIEGERDVSPDLAKADNRVMLLDPSDPYACSGK